jgi:hypothetical protein
MTKSRNSWVGGLLLIAIGLIFLLNQFFDLPFFEYIGTLFVLGLGIFFLAWGVISHHEAFFVPGGILTGIGLGIALIAGPFSLRLAEEGDQSGGIFLVAFAFGWALITIFSALFSEKTMWWPLIPGGIIGVVGGALLVQGPFSVALEWIGKLWPLALIIGGIAVLMGARKVSQPDTADVDELKTAEPPIDKLEIEK